MEITISNSGDSIVAVNNEINATSFKSLIINEFGVVSGFYLENENGMKKALDALESVCVTMGIKDYVIDHIGDGITTQTHVFSENLRKVEMICSLITNQQDSDYESQVVDMEC